MSSSSPFVVVWGNCQAEPIATLLEPSAAAADLKVVHLPPVYEIDEAALHRLQNDLLPRTAVLITQPIRDEYRLPGCGSNQLAALLPHGGRVVTFPITYDTSGFPYQARAHSGDGARVNAPLTDYHDLRAIVAAEQGFTVDEAVKWWPVPSARMVTANASASKAEMHRREQPLDVHTSDLLDGPAMFTLSHPTNITLVEIARRISAVLDLPASPAIVNPEREFLGERRAPVEPAVVDALGWPVSALREEWVLAKTEYPLRAILDVQLPFYRGHPDIITDTRARFADRLALLAL